MGLYTHTGVHMCVFVFMSNAPAVSLIYRKIPFAHGLCLVSACQRLFISCMKLFIDITERSEGCSKEVHRMLDV